MLMKLIKQHAHLFYECHKVNQQVKLSYRKKANQVILVIIIEVQAACSKRSLSSR